MVREFENLLITVYGEDQPGVTSKLTGILANYDAQILDIGKADIQKNLSLGILFRAPMQYSGNIIKDLILICNEIGVTIKFKPISDEEYSNWVSLQGKNRYIVTILGRKLSAKHIASVAEIVSEEGLNIDGIKRLTGRIPLEENEQPSKASVEFSVRGLPTNKEDLQRKLMHLSTEMGIDISFQEDGMFRRMRRLICFDMDSTLIRTEVIDELAEKAGVGEQVKAITEAAMRGEIDFTESFKQRVALLKGLDESAMKEIADRLPITEGVDRLMYVLKRVGFKIAILSGGFTYFGNYLKRKYDIDYVYANNLEIKDGKLTGRHTGEIVDGNRKAELLKLI
ncbi:MAG: phosphoserine phosphatase SerB, partial [Tannerellaceae bacterium]